ncbi:MAG TPA: AAA family ATPase [Herpetosiphonaceae bacterium]
MAQNQATVIRIVIIAPVDGLNQEWIETLQSDPSVHVQARIGVLQRGVETVQHLQPNVLLIDRSIEEIEETIQAVYAAAPETLCIAVLPQQDMAAVRRLVSAGARDILAKPLHARELIASIRQVVQMEDARRQRAGKPSMLARFEPRTSGSKVIVVMGPKGGVGSTTVATNLAVALRHVSGQDVVLADFSLQFGDVAVLLNLWSKHTLHDLAVHYTTLDDGLLERVLVPHESGIKVLLAPNEPELTADMSGKHIAAVVAALRGKFSYVVIDCWSFMDEITETLMTTADQVLLVTTPEVPALKNTKQALEYFTRHGVQRERVALVLNRFPSVKGVTLNDIQQHLKHPIQANLPSDGPAVTYAANKGVPVIQSHPQSWVAQSFLKLAAWVAGDKVQTISYAPTTPKSAEVRPEEQKPLRWRFGLRKPSNS